MKNYCFVVLFLLMLPCIIHGENHGFEFKTLATLEYGQDKSQIGLLKSEELFGGPESFWVTDEGKIYILDSVQSKVKILNSDGSFFESISLENNYNDIAVNSNGDIFLFEQATAKVSCINKEGRFKSSMKVTYEFLNVPRHFRITEDGLTIFNSDLDEFLITKKDERSEELNLLNAPKIPASKGLKTIKGKLINVVKNEDNSAEINLIDAQRNNYYFKINSGKIASIELLGEDDSGNLYFQIESFINSENAIGVQLSVYITDVKGNELYSIKNIENNYYTWTTKLLHITRNGNVYQMLPTETGIKINVWYKK